MKICSMLFRIPFVCDVEKPGSPKVSTIDTTPTTIQLEISPPGNDGGQDILDYKVVYNVQGSTDEQIDQAPVSKYNRGVQVRCVT